MARTARRLTRLYAADGSPSADFNGTIMKWLEGELRIKEHRPTAAFDGLREAYKAAVKTAIESGLTRRDAHRASLSTMTDLLFGHDLAAELQKRLNPGLVNAGGFRTTLSQGVAKNIGENFVNLIVYALVELLEFQDEVLVDKGLPEQLKHVLELSRVVPLKTGDKNIKIPIEADFAIYSRSNPLNAIIVSAKTRLKEVFHIGTMWKMLFDVIGDAHCLKKWGLTANTESKLVDTLYVFATADMVHHGGRNSQGPDVERPQPRNLIAMDASFFDYVFVSKAGIAHAENKIQLGLRSALFYELGCIIDLIEQKYKLDLSQIDS